MKQRGINSYEALQGYYEQRVGNFTLGMGKSPIFWDEVFGDNQFPLDKRSVIHVWNKPKTELIRVIDAGYRYVAR